MSKRKVPATRDDEIFVLKTRMISESTKKTIEIHDFIKKIEDQDNNMREIQSPKFMMAGVEFSIYVYPDFLQYSPGRIGVGLHNYSNEDQMCSVTAKGTGVEKSWEMKKVRAGKQYGWMPGFMTHEKYREWAKVHGDVLKLEVVVTLHTKAEGDDWTR